MNENSLKRLNSYLDSLQKPGVHPLQPVRLTFYVRDTKDSGDVQHLLSSGAVSIISLILSAKCTFRNLKLLPVSQDSGQ